MKKTALIFSTLVASALLSAPVMAADTIAYNATPNAGWFFGNGNNYSPANSAVLTADNGGQLALRMHVTGQVAPASTNTGVYNFALGSSPVSYDWLIASDPNGTGQRIASALITLTNIGTNETYSYNPLLVPDNAVSGQARENSWRLSWGDNPFIPHPGFFTPNIDSTYRVDLSVSGLGDSQPHSLSVFANFGAGVPEPGTWAMMLIGFGLMGAGMRNRSRQSVKVTYA